MIRLDKIEEHLTNMGVTNTFQGESLEEDSMPAEPLDTFMNLNYHIPEWNSENFARLIEEFKVLDGQPIDVENKRKYHQKLRL